MKKIRYLILGMSFSVFAQTNLTNRNSATSPSAPAAISAAVKQATACSAKGTTGCANPVSIDLTANQAATQGAPDPTKAYVRPDGTYAPNLTAAQQITTTKMSTTAAAKSTLYETTTSGTLLTSKPSPNPSHAYP